MLSVIGEYSMARFLAYTMDTELLESIAYRPVTSASDRVTSIHQNQSHEFLTAAHTGLIRSWVYMYSVWQRAHLQSTRKELLSVLTLMHLQVSVWWYGQMVNVFSCSDVFLIILNGYYTQNTCMQLILNCFHITWSCSIR